MEDFNPNKVSVNNGSYFALPYTLTDSEVVLISVPWDVTASYGKGTASGPSAILEASGMFDLLDERIANSWEVKIATVEQDDEIVEMNEQYGEISSAVIEALEAGEDEESVAEQVEKVNEGCERLNDYVYAQAMSYLNRGKVVGLVGGEHSISLGNVKAVADKFDEVGILHIDAHADLREAFEGFEHSHASIMYNVLKDVPQVSTLVQVGIRDYCDDEMTLIKSDERIVLFSDVAMSSSMFKGETWDSICDRIVSALPDNVYISFDIDGLTPDNCPGTGTPVPGGLTYSQADYLLYKVFEAGKRIVGFDLCEVAPSVLGEIDGNIGARILYKMSVLSARSNKFQ